MIHPRVLRYVDEVARCGSIRKAAEALNVAASAINRQIIALEADLCTPIFERLPRGMRLTAAGEALVAYARRSRVGYDRVIAQIETLKGAQQPRVRIATVGGLAGEIIAQALADYRAERPLARFRVDVGTADAVAAAVDAAEADLGIAFDLPRAPKLVVAASLESPCGAVVHHRHPLGERPRLRLAEVAQYPLILPEVGVSIRDHLDHLADGQGLHLDPVMESNSFDVLKAFALIDQGVAILNELDVRRSRLTGAVRFIPIVEMGSFRQVLAVVHRQRAALGALPSHLLERLRTTIELLRGG